VETSTAGSSVEVATLAGGCFWCLEAVFDEMKGVLDVESGYTGGRVENPTYEQVCGGGTGHAEVVQLKLDPHEISFSDILQVFFVIHDPTTLNRQGNDVGAQYRSAVFFHSPEQKAVAQRAIEEITRAGLFRAPIVTEIAPASTFYPAGRYHQQYYARNPNQPYCQYVVAPKVAKFRKHFLERLKARQNATGPRG
jgi:peptide-methionine (S)-S-oxide reductase